MNGDDGWWRLLFFVFKWNNENFITLTTGKVQVGGDLETPMYVLQ